MNNERSHHCRRKDGIEEVYGQLTCVQEVAKAIFGEQNRVDVYLKFLDTVYEDVQNSAGNIRVNENVL